MTGARRRSSLRFHGLALMAGALSARFRTTDRAGIGGGHCFWYSSTCPSLVLLMVPFVLSVYDCTGGT